MTCLWINPYGVGSFGLWAAAVVLKTGLAYGQSPSELNQRPYTLLSLSTALSRYPSILQSLDAVRRRKKILYEHDKAQRHIQTGFWHSTW